MLSRLEALRQIERRRQTPDNFRFPRIRTLPRFDRKEKVNQHPVCQPLLRCSVETPSVRVVRFIDPDRAEVQLIQQKNREAFTWRVIAGRSKEMAALEKAASAASLADINQTVVLRRDPRQMRPLR